VLRRDASAGGGRRVIVLGGTSEIALSIVGELQRRSPREVALVGRDLASLQHAARELRAQGCERVLELELDALALERHGEVVSNAREQLGGVDIVLLAVGVLGERGGLPDDLSDAVGVLQVNVVGAGSLLLHAARLLREDGGGALIVLSSVAAERPRRANAVYGASKAALDSLAQALGDALARDRVRVLVVRPGFVATRMTAGLQAAPLATTPAAVARVAVDGLERGEHTVWAPRALRWLMLAVRLLPRPIFRRLER
jgi:decaprenylphospho-beta-D-erythro-pentofuranosid-2-ulose 2-reductase